MSIQVYEGDGVDPNGPIRPTAVSCSFTGRTADTFPFVDKIGHDIPNAFCWSHKPFYFETADDLRAAKEYAQQFANQYPMLNYRVIVVPQ